MEMYMVEAHRSDAARMHGQNIRAVQVKMGRKYITVSNGRYELKFDMEKERDIDGNIWHRQVSEYSPDYVLYESYNGIFDYYCREGYLDVIRNTNFDAVDTATLHEIFSLINDFREEKRRVSE